MKHTEERSLARLESKMDLLEAEFAYLDTILRKTGFSGGLATLKSTVEEILEEASN